MKYIVPLQKTALLIFFMLLFGFAKSQTDTKPNIIWIMTEDMSPELGCYGYPHVQTPHLDKLSKEGKLYTHMFATSPVCSPTRSAMITGMYQTTIGAHNHRSHRKDDYKLPDPVQPITEYLRQAGYYTVNGDLDKDGSLKKEGKTDYNFNLDREPFDGFDWNNRKPGQPFYAQVMIYITHRSPAWRGEVQESKPQIDPNKLTLPPYYPNHPMARDDWATYLESIQMMDTYVGRFLKKLEEAGLSENTIVIFTSDHGRCMVRDKQFLYDGGIHVPCIIRWPGVISPGSTDTDMHSTIDISATILKMAGATVPPHMEGRPFWGNDIKKKNKKRDYIVAARDRMDETVDMMRTVRNKQFKYIRNYYPERPYMQSNRYKARAYPVWNLLKELKKEGQLTPAQLLFTADTKPKEELYDIVRDPHEINNLAGNKAYIKQLKKMSKILDRWIVETGDKGQIPEKPGTEE